MFILKIRTNQQENYDNMGKLNNNNIIDNNKDNKQQNKKEVAVV